MKVKHWLIVLGVAVAILYTIHIYTGHGGFSGFRAGLGLGH